MSSEVIITVLSVNMHPVAVFFEKTLYIKICLRMWAVSGCQWNNKPGNLVVNMKDTKCTRIVNLKKSERFVLLTTRTCVRTYLSFEVVLPLLRLQSFEASAAVGGDRHAEGPVSSGGELGGEGHGDGPRIAVIAPTHHQIWTGAWGKRQDTSEINS